MWPALLSAALASPVILHVSLREVGDDREQTIAWTVSDEAQDAPPVTWTSIDGRERRAIVAVWPILDEDHSLIDGERSYLAKAVVSERRGRRWVVLTRPSGLISSVRTEPWPVELEGVSPMELQISASSDGLPGPVRALHVSFLAEQVHDDVAVGLLLPGPALAGVSCPAEVDVRGEAVEAWQKLWFSGVAARPGFQRTYACELPAIDGTRTPLPISVRVW